MRELIASKSFFIPIFSHVCSISDTRSMTSTRFFIRGSVRPNRPPFGKAAKLAPAPSKQHEGARPQMKVGWDVFIVVITQHIYHARQCSWWIKRSLHRNDNSVRLLLPDNSNTNLVIKAGGGDYYRPVSSRLALVAPGELDYPWFIRGG